MLFRHSGINKRILLSLLAIAVVSLIGFALVALHGMKSLGDYATRSSVGLGEDTLRISKTALASLAQDGLLRITVDRANLCNAEFQEIESTVQALGDIATRVWNQPEAFPRNRSHSVADKPNDLKSSSVYQIPRGVGLNVVKNDLETSSAMDTFFKAVLPHNTNISDFNLATPSGLFRRFPWGPVAADYDVRKRDWFNRAIDTGKLGWSAPYIGVIAKNLRINCSMPIYNSRKKLVAVVAINVPLKTINERIISTRLNNMGTAFLVDSNRRIIAQEGMSTDGNNWADPQKIELFKLDSMAAQEKKLEEGLLAGRPGVIRANFRGKDSYIAHAPMQTTQWSVLFILPVDAVNAPIVPTEQAILSQARLVSSQVTGRIRESLLILAVMFAVIVAGVYLVARRVANLITGPILELDAGARIVGAGDLDHRIEIRSGDEIEALADTFNKMTENLKNYIRNLTETTAAKERIQSELKVATDIQASLLPRLFPAFPDRAEFDIFAQMDPAKEVGGDFYDFFLVDDDHLCFLIADVSDKGVPAALYMMVAKTLLKTEAMRGVPPDEVLSRVNNVLAPDNDSCMFVTVFCAILNTATGELQYANAGHNPPLLATSGKEFSYLTVKAGFVLGPIADSVYTAETLTLSPGDIFVAYTDGVTEALNREGLLFGEGRLLETLREQQGNDLGLIIHELRETVSLFADGAPQSDDITMLAIRFNGKRTPGAGKATA